MAGEMITIAMEQRFPAGVVGPEPVTLDVRAYLVPHDSGLVLVDTGMDPAGRAIDEALAGAGADWSDVSAVVVTHGHPDHTGALDHARSSANDVPVFASPLEGIGRIQPLADGAAVGTLRAFATPGHTPGHLSLVDENRGLLFVGDCLGVLGGRLVRAPDRFTADGEEAERSLRRLLDLRGSRMLFSHGPEIGRPWEALDDLLANR